MTQAAQVGPVARLSTLLLVAWTLTSVSACRSARPTPTPAATAERNFLESGQASWYGPGFYGRRTASGEIFDGKSSTAAHRTLPFGTLVEVVNLDNGRRLVVRINDRGPFIKNRIVDLSKAAAEALGVVGPGVARVELYLVEAPPADDGGSFTVQVGAFHEAERAQALVDELKPRFADMEVRSDGTWHRVQLAQRIRREAAEVLRQSLAALGYAAVVVPLPPEAAVPNP